MLIRAVVSYVTVLHASVPLFQGDHEMYIHDDLPKQLVKDGLNHKLLYSFLLHSTFLANNYSDDNTTCQYEVSQLIERAFGCSIVLWSTITYIYFSILSHVIDHGGTYCQVIYSALSVD